jgi:FAD/FMN-containing dehydrogenase
MAIDTTIAGLDELGGALRGRVVTPGDSDYDQVRAVWNGMHDRRPAAIIQCAGTADVMAAVNFARASGLPLAVRGGGHSIPGFSTVDDGIVIDLSPMRGVRVDAEKRIATVEGGSLWADVDHETQAFGLATTGGLISTTGVGGFTLGGGIGWLMRKAGLAADNIVGADVVTADGRVVRADEELLWGLRGGGGNFGVVTSFDLRLHEVGPLVVGGPVFWHGRHAREVLQFFRDISPGLPDELTLLANLLTGPPAPFLPESVHGEPLVAIVAAYAGPIDEGDRAVAPIKSFGEPVADLLGPLPYVVLQSLLDPLWGPGAHNYMQSGYVPALDDDTIEVLLAAHGAMTNATEEIHIHQMGGAVARVPAADTAFGDRSAPFLMNSIARWTDPAETDRHRAWQRELYRTMGPHMTGGTYSNFAGDADAADVSYRGSARDRLAALKAKYDPGNLFRRNQNVLPA